MDMIDLKLPKKSTKEMKAGMMPSPVERDEYPWGTRITFNEEVLAKLGDVFDDAEIGETMKVMGEAKVISKRADDSVGTDGKKKKNRSLEIQMTSINVNCTSADDKMPIADFMKKRQQKK